MGLLFESLLLDAVAIATGLVLLVCLYFQHKFSYWKNRGVPYAEPSFLFGNFRSVLFQQECLGDYFKKLYDLGSGNPVFGFYIFSRPGLVIRDTELIKHIMVKDFNVFYDRHVHSNPKTDPLSRNLFLIRGPAWKYLRIKLTPTFTTFRMKQMVPLMSKCASQLTSYLRNTADLNRVIEVKEAVAKYATDVISTCAFGIESNCLIDPKAEFREFGRKIFEFHTYRSFEFMSLFMLPMAVKMFDLKFFTDKATVFLTKVFWETVKQREENNIVREDFVQLLIQLKNKGFVDDEDGKNKAPSEEIQEQKIDFEFKGDNLAAQAAIFFTAGFESNATTTSFTLYELAMQPLIQDKLRAEIVEILDREKGNVSYEAIKEMKYLHMVVSETLRKYPPLPMLDRVANRDYVIPGTKTVIEKGTPVFIPLMGLQMDPEVFPDPEKFDPERFSDENRKNRNQFHYMPFGEGPKYCIGRRFGFLAAKSSLITVLSEFAVSPCPETPVPLVLNPKAVILASQGGIPLRFTKLNS